MYSNWALGLWIALRLQHLVEPALRQIAPAEPLMPAAAPLGIALKVSYGPLECVYLVGHIRLRRGSTRRSSSYAACPTRSPGTTKFSLVSRAQVLAWSWMSAAFPKMDCLQSLQVRSFALFAACPMSYQTDVPVFED